MANNYIPGIDVSHHNGDIDWSKVKDEGIAFGFAKATEGTSVVDTHFAANYAAMQKFQILRGAYHFFRPSVDAQAQAASFLRQVPSIGKGDLPAVLDVEVSDGQSPQAVVNGIQKWLDSVEAALDRTPIIYTSATLWNSNLGSSDAFGRYQLWVAHYTSKLSPNLPAGFDDYAFWQYSESGAVSGIAGSVDMDRFKGTRQDLEQLAGS